MLVAVLAQAKDSLPPRYHQWLDRDVAYIITHEERGAFLKLASNADRDKFIQRFWEIRNPSPGAPTNPYREEHYRRLAYANQFFGLDTGTPGWRTDRGRVYIELGEPQQKAVYLGYQKVRPMEIWFYQNTNPALPPYFYIVFYKPDQTSGYKLYSPYMDGPEKLVTTDPGSRAGSLNVLQRQLGDEVARTALSLLPDEPVDLNTAASSLQSDVMLSAIKTLPDQPINKDRLNRRREILESVTHRVLLGNEFLDVLAVPLQEVDGTVNLHYALRLRRPEDFAIAQAKGDRYYYALEVTARVLTPGNQPIFTQTDSLSHYLSDTEFQSMKNKALAYEGLLPLPPGKYKIEFTLTNKVKQTAFRAERQVAIPAPPASGLWMTEPVAFSAVEPIGRLQQGQVPFAVAGVRFQPEVGAHADLVVGQDLQVFYQLREPPSDPHDNAGKKISVEYGYGRPGMPGDSKVLREEVSRDQFDRAGALLTGKKIPVSTLPVGNYRLAITVTDPQTREKVYGTLAFRISRQGPVPTWYVHDDHLADSVLNGVADYHRALCYLAAHDNANAERWLKSALRKNPHNAQFTSALVGVYFDRHAYPAIADLYAHGNVDGTNDELTVLRTAESLDRGGQTRKAVALLQSALALNAHSGPLNLALANLYKRSGDLQKAQESERKARLLMSSPPG